MLWFVTDDKCVQIVNDKSINKQREFDYLDFIFIQV